MMLPYKEVELAIKYESNLFGFTAMKAVQSYEKEYFQYLCQPFNFLNTIFEKN